MRLNQLDYNYFSTLILFIPFFLLNEMGLKEMYHFLAVYFIMFIILEESYKSHLDLHFL